MKISYNWLQEYIKEKLPKPEKAAEALTMHSLEVEEVKKTGGDFLFNIDVLSNRAHDCSSHIGIARELAAVLGLTLKLPVFKVKEDKKIVSNNFIKIIVEDKEDCPRYCARVISDVKIASSPKWMQDKLKFCGLKPISNVVDIMNYVMLEIGQPLHAFDAGKMAGDKIIVRRAKNKEKIVTLDNEEYVLNKDILVISDEEKPVAIAGIKGGKYPEVDGNTKTIIIESANFNSSLIRRGSRKIGLRTDASSRFEGSLDPNLAEEAINRAAFLVQEIANGKVAKGVIDIYPHKSLPKQVNLDFSYLTNLLGFKIPLNKAKSIVRGLGLKIQKSDAFRMMVEVPTRRRDIVIPEDLIEEISRIYGYEKVPAVMPRASLITPERNDNLFWSDMAKDTMKAFGFTESYNYSFINSKDVENFSLSAEKLIEIVNPISSEYQFLRPSLIINLLKNVGSNFRHFDDIKVFELDKLYVRSNGKIVEKAMITSLLASKRDKSHDQFFELKGIIDSLLNKMGISDIWYDFYQATPEDSKANLWNQERMAEIKVGDTEIGFVGEISPEILRSLKIEGNVSVFDIDFERLREIASEENEYQPISRFPAAVRDLALLVPQDVLIEEILNKINIAGGPLVRDVDLFDMYEGEAVPQGKKSIAFHIVYQAEDRTLKSEEIDVVHQRIVSVLEKDPAWQVRK